MIIRRRFPNFFSGFEDQETEHEVNSKEELLSIDWIKYLIEMPNSMGMFYSSGKSADHLMHLSRGKDGKIIYFVVGYIKGNGAELGLTDYHLEFANKI